MITLKTLPQASAQEVFDQITQHLLRQGKAAISSTGACRYRVEAQGEVLKCAAGCLIADDEYNRLFENVAWDDLADRNKVPSHHVALVQQLQRIHDRESFGTWTYYFHKIARDFGLTFQQPS